MNKFNPDCPYAECKGPLVRLPYTTTLVNCQCAADELRDDNRHQKSAAMIDDDFIENICENLRCALISVLHNPGDEDDYDMAVDEMRNIGRVLDEMTPEGD
jgi:hypothetical protein